jgi:glycosyltransferase involved in cell wall biosynthesis
MVSISVCMIVKNEEAVLERCLKCICGIADELIVVDTGSMDKTKEIAARYTDRIYDFPWDNDFSAARNFSFSKATGDYIYIADADEVIDEENRKKFLRLKEVLSPEIDIVQMKYANQLQYNCTYNFDVEYRPKLFKRLREFHWIDPVHESVRLQPEVFDSDIVVKHMPQQLHAPRDFSIYQCHLGEGLSEKLHRLYARELFIAGTDSDFLEAYPYFESTLHDETKSQKEVRASQCVAARASRLKNDDFNFFKVALKSVVGSPVAEVCCELGAYYFEKEDYEEAATWYYTAAFGAESELDIHSSGDVPLRGLSDCFARLGDAQESEKYRELAEKWTIPEHD